jgi:hypothetical protein
MISIRQFAAAAVFGVAIVAAAGCASSDTRPDGIPLSAQELGSGREEVIFNAPNDGTVYVVDATRHETIYSGRVKKGDHLKVDAKNDKIFVNNVSIKDEDLLADHKFKVYFEPSAEATASDSTTIIRTEPGAAQPAGGTVIQTDPNARTTVTTDPNAPSAQPKTSVTTDPNTGKTTVTTDPNAPAATPPPAPRTTVTTPEGATITSDPNSGTTTIKKE